MDDLRSLEQRVRALERQLDTLGDNHPDPCLVFVAKTVKIGSTYPTTAKAWYGIQDQVIGGSESEGTVATLAATTNPKGLAFNTLGTAVPPEGTAVVVVQESGSGRLTFQY